MPPPLITPPPPPRPVPHLTVKGLHREFLRAGSDVMQVFAFYSSDDKLSFGGNEVGTKFTVSGGTPSLHTAHTANPDDATPSLHTAHTDHTANPDDATPSLHTAHTAHTANPDDATPSLHTAHTDHTANPDDATSLNELCPSTELVELRCDFLFGYDKTRAPPRNFRWGTDSWAPKPTYPQNLVSPRISATFLMLENTTFLHTCEEKSCLNTLISGGRPPMIS